MMKSFNKKLALLLALIMMIVPFSGIIGVSAEEANGAFLSDDELSQHVLGDEIYSYDFTKMTAADAAPEGWIHDFNNPKLQWVDINAGDYNPQPVVPKDGYLGWADNGWTYTMTLPELGTENYSVTMELAGTQSFGIASGVPNDYTKTTTQAQLYFSYDDITGDGAKEYFFETARRIETNKYGIYLDETYKATPATNFLWDSDGLNLVAYENYQKIKFTVNRYNGVSHFYVNGVFVGSVTEAEDSENLLDRVAIIKTMGGPELKIYSVATYELVPCYVGETIVDSDADFADMPVGEKNVLPEGWDNYFYDGIGYYYSYEGAVAVNYKVQDHEFGEDENGKYLKYNSPWADHSITLPELGTENYVATVKLQIGRDGGSVSVITDILNDYKNTPYVTHSLVYPNDKYARMIVKKNMGPGKEGTSNKGTTLASAELPTYYSEGENADGKLDKGDIIEITVINCNNITTFYLNGKYALSLENANTDALSDRLAIGFNDNPGTKLYSVKVNAIEPEPTKTVNINIPDEPAVKYEVYKNTAFKELPAPQRDGYSFIGFYTDAELTKAADKNASVYEYTDIYTKWALAPIEVPVSNTYDQSGLTFANVPDNDYTHCSSNIGAKFPNGYIGQFGAYVADDCGINNSKAMKIITATGYNYYWPTAFMLYSTDKTAFIPQSNTKYRLMLKYKVNSLSNASDSKDINIVLRSVNSNGDANLLDLGATQTEPAYDVGSGVYQYGIVNNQPIMRGTVTGGWVEDELIFTTGEAPNALFIAVVTTGVGANAALDLEMYLDDIIIQKIDNYDGFSKGDVNGDGEVDIIDLVRLKKMSLGTLDHAWSGDLNADYIVAAAEDLGILRRLLLNAEAVVNNPQAIVLGGNTYDYVWGDEFNGISLEDSKWEWSKETTGMQTSDPNEYLILDDDRAIEVKDGTLRMTSSVIAEKEDGSKLYASPASVHTEGKMSYLYGYCEIRAKVPFGKGLWPSFWAVSDKILHQNINRKYVAEIDIFEVFGTDDGVVPNLHKWYNKNIYNYDEIHGVNYKNHTQFNNANFSEDINNTYYFGNIQDISKLSNEYHTYGFEWTPTEISMYVDGEKYMTYDIVNSYDECDDMNGFHEPIVIIFNNHLFVPSGDYIPDYEPGVPTLITGSEENLSSVFEIDYFRLYQNKSIADSAIYFGS